MKNARREWWPSSVRFRTWPLPAGLLAIIFMNVGAFAADTPKDFDPEVARRFASVAGWQGFWETSETRGFSKSNVYGYTITAYEADSHGRFELTRGKTGWAPRYGEFRWTGTGEVSGTTSESVSTWSKSGPRMVGEDSQIVGGGRDSTSRVEFNLWLGRQHASIHAGAGTGNVAVTRKTGRGVRQLSSADGRHHYEDVVIDETWSAAIMEFFIPNYEKDTRNWAVVQGGPGVLAFAYEERHHVSIGGLKRSRVVMAPVYEDLEVEVTIAGYADWRPKGSISDPTGPGNALVARAVLKPKAGKTRELPEVELFRFELIDTSREPGVCLNWPLAAKDEEYDLRFANLAAATSAESIAALRKFVTDWGLISSGDYDLANMPADGVPRVSFGEVTEDGQRAELSEPPKDDAGQPYADVAIESYDFGAKSELRVVCLLKDGREIIGLMKDEGGEQDLVRLPKRAGPDWVAESWRKENEVMDLAAGNDNEKVDGQDHNGDGFTLYEEYRGWVENGKHIEGDPKRKDFFVLNDIGADAVGGFRLFQRESRIKVHHKLTAKEMSTDERLMNGNHRDAPHRVRQHGVWIYNADGTGIPDAGTTGMTTADTDNAFRPGRVRYITIETRTIRDATFSRATGMSRYNLSERDAAFGYDRAVAHELLHAVGVDHHGEGESAGGYYFRSASDPNNASRRAGFARGVPHTSEIDLRKDSGYGYSGHELDRTPPVTFIWEDTRRDLAEELAPLFERKLTEERARQAQNPPPPGEDPGRWATQFPAYGKDAFYWRESALFDSIAYRNNEFEIFVTTSDPSQADSGNELCLMRYYFAIAYPITGRKDAFYLVRPGANRAGRSICRSPEGTGANSSSHQPQSRFGDSAAGRGNCFAQICPNDAIPPRKL